MTALEYQSDPAVDQLDLLLVPPRQRPGNANLQSRRRRPTNTITTKPPYQSDGLIVGSIDVGRQHLAQQAGVDVVDEATDDVPMGDERRAADAQQ